MNLSQNFELQIQLLLQVVVIV